MMGLMLMEERKEQKEQKAGENYHVPGTKGSD